MRIMIFMTSYYNNLSGSGKSVFINSTLRSLSRKFFLPLIVVTVMFSGCEEDPTEIGSGILPQVDFVNLVSSDTFSVSSYTRYIDTLRSTNPFYSYLGSLYDPYFGLSTADFVSQLWLYSSWPSTGASVDSLLMSLHVVDVVGEYIGDQVVNIYEVDEFMHLDSVYYTNRSVPVKQFLASFTIPPGLESDTIIQVHLPISMADEFLRDTSMLFLATDTIDFRNYFNGLYFEYPQSDNYHLLKLDMLGGDSFITLFFTDSTTFANSYTFLFNSKAVLYNRYNHDLEAAEPDKKIKYINQPVEDTLSYAQGLNGVFTQITIPGLEDLKDQMPVGINKARLFLPAYVNTTDYTEDLIPESVVARYVDSEGARRYIPDFLLSPDFFDGSYNAINDQYVLNITNFVQQYLEGEIPEPFIEIVLSSFDESNLIMMANSATTAPHIEITYTDLK